MSTQPLSDFATNPHDLIGRTVQVRPNRFVLGGYPSWPVVVKKVNGKVLYGEHGDGYDIESGLQVYGFGSMCHEIIAVGTFE